MPKMKTKSSAAKRFKVTGKNKLMRNKMNRNHNFTKKSPKRKRHLRKQTLVSAADVKTMKKVMPYR